MTDNAKTRRSILFGALSALVAAAVVAVVRQRNVPDLIVQSDESFTGDIRVAIGGEVIAPGTYTLRGDVRLADVIAAAGGYTDGAARDVLNPAARVSDGQTYTIPIRPTLAARAATATAHTSVSPAAPVALAAVPTAAPLPPTTAPTPTTESTDDPGSDTSASAVAALEDVATYVEPEVAALATEPQGTGTARGTRAPRVPRPPRASGAPRATAPRRNSAPPVRATAPPKAKASPRAMPSRGAAAAPAHAATNINTAAKEALASLPRVSPTLADRIIADRTAHGPYTRVEDLTRVQGISRRTVDELRSHITVG